MLLSGDWRQILPVVRNGNRASIVAATLKRSPLWDIAVNLRLSANMRIRGSDEAAEIFRDFTLAVGDGRANLSENGTRSSKIEIPDHLLLEPSTPSALCDFVFDNFVEMFALAGEEYQSWIGSRAVLCSTNEQVDQFNAIMHNRTPGAEFVHLSVDTQLVEEGSGVPSVQTHHLNAFTPSGMPPHCLQVKVGTPVSGVASRRRVSGRRTLF